MCQNLDFMFKTLLFAFVLLIMSFMCAPSVWAFYSAPTNTPPTNNNSMIQSSPNVVVQTSPQVFQQVKNFFGHSAYEDFQSCPVQKLFTIPRGQSE